MSSAFLEKGETLLINALGLELPKSKRTIQDGFTYFGCKKSIKKLSTSILLKGADSLNDKQIAQMGATGASVEELEENKYSTFQVLLVVLNEVERDCERLRDSH